MRTAFVNYRSTAEDLMTTASRRNAWIAKIALERHRLANPFIAQAHALKSAALRSRHPAEFQRTLGIRTTTPSVSRDSFVEELVYRFLITRGDTLGGSMRNVGGALAQRKLSRAIISALAVEGLTFRWQHSQTKAWADGTGEEPDIELYLRAISWKSGEEHRTAVFNLGVPVVKNNVDLCLLECAPSELPAAKKKPSLYVALGELKGGIDPAGADEHWKTADSALSRIRKAFARVKFKPRLFFVGAAIEKKMAREIWSMLRTGSLTNAANLTNDDQVASLTRWLCSL